MKKVRAFLCAFLALLSAGLSSPRALAQKDKESLPPGLSQSSSLTEVLDWLNKNSFPLARVGLERERIDSSASFGDPDPPTVHESAVLSQGFRLASVEGCRLRLRNDDAKILSYGTSANDFNSGSLSLFRQRKPDQTPDPADLYIWLHRLRPEGDAPYLHTKNQEKGRAYGRWRTKFKAKRTRSSDIVVLEVPESQPGEVKDYMYSGKVSFTFDDLVSSEQFYRAFSRAIRLCRK